MRHVVYFFLPEQPQASGQAIGFIREGEERNAESKYPDRNAPPKQYVASADESGEIHFKGENKMQRKTRNTLLSRILCMMLIVAMALFTVGCKNEKDAKKSGQDVNVTEQGKDSAVTELGQGAVSFDFSVVDKDGNETKFVIHTDKETVGDALLENDLIAGEESEYGLYVKKVNGIVADYDVDQTYWAFYVNGEYAMSGVDSTKIEAGAEYSFKVSK